MIFDYDVGRKITLAGRVLEAHDLTLSTLNLLVLVVLEILICHSELVAIAIFSWPHSTSTRGSWTRSFGLSLHELGELRLKILGLDLIDLVFF